MQPYFYLFVCGISLGANLQAFSDLRNRWWRGLALLGAIISGVGVALDFAVIIGIVH